MNRTADAIARVVAAPVGNHPAEEGLDDALLKTNSSDVLRFTRPEWDRP